MSIVALALALRLFHLDWDAGHAFHPDERAMAFAVERISFSEGRFDPDFFAYGTLPIYLVAAARDLTAAATGRTPDFGELLLLGRGLSVLSGVGAVVVLFLFGRRRAGLPTGALAALLLAVAPIHLQNSRYFTVDSLLTLLTLLALMQMVKLAESGAWRPAILAGLFLGLACGTKLSGASLVLPLLLAGFLGSAKRQLKERAVAAAGLCSAALFAAAGAFLFAEPMLLLRPEAVFASLAEQARIARHAGMVPYTLQYLGTSTVFYPLKQLLFWGLGPVLGAAIAASAILSWGRRERPGRTTLVLVSWLVPYLAFFAFLEVKYPRYLLPAVPLLVLGASWVWMRWARESAFARAAVLLLAGATAFHGFALMNLFANPHPAVSASAWYLEQAPDGSTVLTPDWDEGFPLQLGGPSGGKRLETLSAPFYDQPDDAGKLSLLAERFERADFIVFPTRRIYGSIFRARERFPLTSNLLANLFAGNLGFDLVAAFESRPRLLGLELADELADESVTVYDHPRVLIFRKRIALSSDEIGVRALEVPAPAWSLDDFLSASPEPRPAHVAAVPWLRAVGLLAAVEILGLVAFVLLRPLWRGPGLFAAAKVLGLFGFAYLTWLFAEAGGARFDAGTCRWQFAVLLAIAAATWWRSGRPAPGRRELLWSTVLFYSVVGLFLGLRAFQPAIYWGEKPMDFGILNQLLRSEILPPQDPWFAGASLNYSYFGHYVVAVLGKLSNLGAGHLFNFAIALFAGLASTAALASGLLLAPRIRSGVRTGALAVLFVVALGNLSGFATWLRSRRLDFDFFWATSRVIPDTINEYPLWSLLFADLHAHLLALPLVVLLAGLVARGPVLLESPLERGAARAVFAVFAGWLLGLVAVTSTWSAVSMSLLMFVATTSAWWRRRRDGDSRNIPDLLLTVLLPLAISALTATIGFAPYWRSFHGPEGTFGLHIGPLASVSQIGQLFGLILIVLAPLCFSPVRASLARIWPRRGAGRKALLIGAGVLVAAVVGVCALLPARWTLLVLTGLAFVGCFSRRRRGWAPALTLLATGLTLLTAAEFFYLWDRMNTVFKYHYDARVCLSLAAAIVLATMARRSRSPAPGEATARFRLGRLWRFAIGLGVALSVATAGMAAVGLLRVPRVQGPVWTLDGQAYLRGAEADEAAALRWLNANVANSPSVLEAWGPSYGAFGRVSMHTGLPTPLGWDYHVFQRAHPWSEIEERKRSIAAVFEAEDGGEVCQALEELSVELVYFGGLERSTYGEASAARLAAWPEILQPVFRNPTVTIYRVVPRIAGCSNVGAPRPAAAVVARSPGAVGSLREPRGIVPVPDGYWVSDFGRHRVVKFGLDREPLTAFGRQGARAGEFEQPCAVALTRDGRLLVADTWNHRLQLFEPDGRVAAIFVAGLFGPRGVAVDPQTGEIFVADTGNHRIVRMSPAGESLGTIGKQGSGPGEFWEPMGVAVSADGRLAIADAANGRVQILERDGSWRASWPVADWRREVYSEPALAFSESGDLWLTVPLAGEIRAFDRSGRQFARLAVPDAGGEDSRPMGLAFAAGGESLVVTTLDGRLVELPVLRSAPGATAPLAEVR